MSDHMLSQDQIDALIRGGDSVQKEQKDTTEFSAQDISENALLLFESLESKVGETISLITSVEAKTVRKNGYLSSFGNISDRRLIISLCSSDKGNELLIFLDEDAATNILSQIAKTPDDQNIFSESNMDVLGKIIEAVAEELSKQISLLTSKRCTLNVALPKGPSGLQDFIQTTKNYLVLEYSLEWDGIEVGEMGFILDNDQLEEQFTKQTDEKPRFNDPMETEPVPSLDSLLESMSDSHDDILSHFTDSQAYAEEEDVVVKPVQFGQLKQSTKSYTENTDANLEIILDLPVTLTVELGRTRKTLKEILNLKPGSVVELDRLAGEPVDILANGVFVAKGEVVVIDETFGVKVVEIATKEQRLNRIK